MSKTNTKKALLKDDCIRFIKSIDVVHTKRGNQTDQSSTSTTTNSRFRLEGSKDMQRDLFDAFVNSNILKPNLGTKVVCLEDSGSGWYRKKNEIEFDDQKDMFIYLINKAIHNKLKGVEETHQKRLGIYNFAKDLEIKDKRQYGYPERYNGKLTDRELKWTHQVDNYYTCKLKMADIISIYDNREALLIDFETYGYSYYNKDHTSVTLEIELGWNEKQTESKDLPMYDFNVNISSLKLCWTDIDNENQPRYTDLACGDVEWKYSANRDKKWVKQVKYCGGRFSDNNRDVSLNTYVIYMREWMHNKQETKKTETLRAARLLTQLNILKDMYPEAEIVKKTMWKTDLKKLTHKSERCLERISYSRHYHGEDNYTIVFKSGSYLAYEKNMMQTESAIGEAYLGAFDVEYVAPKLRTAKDMSEKFVDQKEAKREEVAS